MLEAEYAAMRQAEERHWWYLGLHDQVRRALARCRGAVSGPGRVLDAGCGTGKVLELLADLQPVGLDLSATALSLARQRGDFPLVRASAVTLPFADAAFDVALSLDVLANVPPGEVSAAFAELYRVLAPGGALILNLVAFQALYAEHDRAVGVVRRYRAGEVREMLAGAGFALDILSYSNTILFPAAAVVRLARRRRRPDHEPVSDLAPLPGPINAALAAVRRFENAVVVGKTLAFPFGLSVFALARKPGRGVSGNLQPVGKGL
ncbi:MAG: methylase involved in ubiquinone/menaquinone biosynthesis [Solidesulfovibrio magneticus str. Maddingley MBC34]|uniref:Methylase involved in ubiquinone/menaquinone biosynthesis n=1 Tax=Solidesulfovibrio magneticus str. Maddingley MBC34 TaxID=1206767 RepID=K6GR94_9BACT|nr:MAG: methylase involved in ubiquinone/menaquinone biosynthesis [Solidesulfovibrio magneticus str. Maddingley MBC34]